MDDATLAQQPRTEIEPAIGDWAADRVPHFGMHELEERPYDFETRVGRNDRCLPVRSKALDLRRDLGAKDTQARNRDVTRSSVTGRPMGAGDLVEITLEPVRNVGRREAVANVRLSVDV